MFYAKIKALGENLAEAYVLGKNSVLYQATKDS